MVLYFYRYRIVRLLVGVFVSCVKAHLLLSISIQSMLRRLAFSSTIRQSTPSSWLGSGSSAVAATYPSDLLSSKTTSLSTTLPSSSHQQQTQIRLKSGRSQRGLYDGKDVRFGNNVPFSLKKTRRRWNPNVQHKRVYSEILDEMIPFHITTSALRSIDKYGGLDEYLLKSKHVSTRG